MGTVFDGVLQDQRVVDKQGTWVVLVLEFGETVEVPIAYKIHWEHGMLGCNLKRQIDIGLLAVEVTVTMEGVILVVLRGCHTA